METKAFKPASRLGGAQFQVDVELSTVSYSDVFETPGGIGGQLSVCVSPNGGTGKVQVTLASEERIAASVDGSDLEWVDVPDDLGATSFTSQMTQHIAGATAIRFQCTNATGPVRFQATAG